MSKRKWYTKAIYLGVALAMTVGLLMVPAAGAAPVDSEPAASPDLTDVECGSLAAGIGYGAVGVDMGTAEWTTTVEATTPHSGTYSGKLSPGATVSGLAAAKVPYGGDLTAFSILDETAMVFWTYYDTAGMTSFAALWLDSDDDGVADLALLNKGWSAGTIPLAPNTWLDAHLSTAQAPDTWHVYGYTAATGKLTSPVTLCDSVAYDANTWKSLDDWAALVCTADGTVGDAEVLCVGQMIGGVPGSSGCFAYADEMIIDGVTYGMEPCYELEPDIAYNVKTADETFTVMDACGPVSGDLVSNWVVTKGCGAGEVSIVGGGEDGDNFITVRMVVKGDCNITADVDGLPGIVQAEKKWGEIYCTELVSEDTLVDDEYLVTETVTASFLWEDCITELELPAEDAVVDWWLMDIDALAAVQALEAALGDDPCDEDGGCGTYTPDFFEYDIDGLDGIEADEVFDSPGEALLEIYAQYELDDITEKPTNYIDGAAPDATHEQTESDVDGETAVTVHTEAPTSVILATLTDYPIDKHGQNTVCVQHETWVAPPPPPTIEKLPDIVWAGEKDVIEWRLPADAEDQYVIFYLEDPSVGTFEGTDPWFTPPAPFGIAAIKDTAITTVVLEYDCGDAYGVARVVLHSDKQGKANVVAALLSGVHAPGQSNPNQGMLDGIVSQQGFLVFFLAFEDVELVNLPDDVDNDEAWTEAGETTSDLAVDDEGLLRLRVKGYFEDPVLDSTRPSKGQDTDGDGLTDIILPAGRWVLPDDYPILADGLLWQLNKPHWDIMDTPIDEIVSMLDADGDQVETLGAYGDGACFESVLYDTTLTEAEQLAAYLEGLVSCYPVIGPFSKLQPPTETGWEICDVTWDNVAELLTFYPAVPADGNEIDEFDIFPWCRTTVVPDGLLTPEDAVMPPAEILFVVTDGDGNLTAVNKADLYYRDEDCTFGTLSVDGEVYTNPYYWQEIPANLMIPAMYGSGPAGYEWDSWGTDVTVNGPYGFWDSLSVWASDLVFARTLAGLGPTETPEVIKVYTDNRGEAWAEFEQKDFDSSEIKAVASYPYLIGDHPAVVSNKVTKLSENLKDINVAWERLDDMYDMLYVFVRNYDGTPATCEPIDWNIDGIAGTIISLLADTAGPCDNACLDITCEGSIAAGSRSAESCTREMTTAEIADFGAAEITVPLDRFHREIVATGEPLFGVDEDPEDYAIAGIKVSSSLGDDVDIIIKIHDCWEDEIVFDEDQILLFGEEVSGDVVEWYLAYGQDADLAAVNIWTYPAGAATVTLLDVETTMPDGLLIWHYNLADGWTFYKKGWGASNTLTTMVPGGYIGIVPTAGTWEIPQS